MSDRIIIINATTEGIMSLLEPEVQEARRIVNLIKKINRHWKINNTGYSLFRCTTPTSRAVLMRDAKGYILHALDATYFSNLEFDEALNMMKKNMAKDIVNQKMGWRPS